MKDLRKIHYIKYDTTLSPSKELKINSKAGAGSLFKGIVENYFKDDESSLCDECLNNLLILRSRQRLDNKIMFPSPVTGGYRDPSAITRRLHAIQRRAGVPKIRFHDLRHSFATLSLEQGMDIKTISHMLGHTDAGFTMNTYMHVTDNMQQTVASAMGNLISEKENEQRNKRLQFPA